MKPAVFDYGVAAGAAIPEGAKPVSGNQSLGPMLNLRLARPERLVDVSRLQSLRETVEHPDRVRLGAATTHAEIEDGAVPDPTGGWLRDAAAHIAHRAVRNRGTLGGSLAHADPAADWVIVMTGLCASVVIEGPDGAREVPMADFITGPYATVLAPQDVLVAVDVPRPGADARWGYWKFVRQVGEFAKASAAVLHDPATGRIRCALGATGGAPVILSAPEEIIAGHTSPADAVDEALPGRSRAARAMHVAALTRALAGVHGAAAGDGE